MGRVWEGDTASQDKNFSEIWVLNLRVHVDAFKIEVHTLKSRILLKLLPEFQT